MRARRDEFNATWLADDDLVFAYHEWVRMRLVEARNGEDPPVDAVAPWNVQPLAADIVRFGNTNAWLWATTAIGLLAELIFCAERAAPFPSHTVGHRYDLNLVVERLRVIRNAACHPAFQRGDAGSGPPPIEVVYTDMQDDDDADVAEAAVRLAVDWSEFGSKPVTYFALRMLNSAGDKYADVIGLQV